MYIVAFKYGQNLCISLSASEALDDVDGAATGLRLRSQIMTCIILWYDSNSDVWRCPYVMYILELVFFVSHMRYWNQSHDVTHVLSERRVVCVPRAVSAGSLSSVCVKLVDFFVNKNVHVFAAMIHCLQVTYFADIQYDVNICCARSAAYERFQYISAFCI